MQRHGRFRSSETEISDQLSEERTLAGRTLLISGGSRGIGLAIALRAARDGANVALIARTVEPHETLEGTVYTAARAIEQAGGNALPIVGDVRNDEDILAAVSATVEQFGAIDVCVNNASAIDLSGIDELPMKRYDLMQDVNTRGTYALSRACVPHLRTGINPHILTLAPPISLELRWLAPHTAYTIAKYGMTLCALGLAAELLPDRIASNALWPRTLVATAAVRNLLGGETAMSRARTPAIYADAAHLVLTSDSETMTGKALLCEDVLVAGGITDFGAYGPWNDAELTVDLFVDAASPELVAQ
jgi:citronellol/citronellal dehydrogenase